MRFEGNVSMGRADDSDRWFLTWGSCAPRGIWGCYWHLVGTGQGCFGTSYNAQDSPHNRIVWFRMLIVPQLRNLDEASICQAGGYLVKGLKAGVRNSKDVERGKARAAGDEATEVGLGGNGERADDFGLVGQGKEFDFTASEVGSNCRVLNRGVP